MSSIYEEFDPTPEHRANLLKMAAFLDTLPPENLDMAAIISDWGTAEREVDLSPECNSVCCILGFTNHVLGTLSDRLFISSTEYGVDWQKSRKLWAYLFGPCNPNDPKLMAGRLREAARANLPENEQ